MLRSSPRGSSFQVEEIGIECVDSGILCATVPTRRSQLLWVVKNCKLDTVLVSLSRGNLELRTSFGGRIYHLSRK